MFFCTFDESCYVHQMHFYLHAEKKGTYLFRFRFLLQPCLCASNLFLRRFSIYSSWNETTTTTSWKKWTLLNWIWEEWVNGGAYTSWTKYVPRARKEKSARTQHNTTKHNKYSQDSEWKNNNRNSNSATEYPYQNTEHLPTHW